MSYHEHWCFRLVSWVKSWYQFLSHLIWRYILWLLVEKARAVWVYSLYGYDKFFRAGKKYTFLGKSIGQEKGNVCWLRYELPSNPIFHSFTHVLFTVRSLFNLRNFQKFTFSRHKFVCFFFLIYCLFSLSICDSSSTKYSQVNDFLIILELWVINALSGRSKII